MLTKEELTRLVEIVKSKKQKSNQDYIILGKLLLMLEKKQVPEG